MAQHILDRVAASLRPNSRLADCRKVLADAQQELAQLDERIAQAERSATNPCVSDEDARAACERVADFQLLKRRLARGVEELREVIAQKEEARRSEERASAYAEAKAARDALTERWRAFREHYAQLMQLLSDTHENDQLIAQANRMLPEGAERLRSAEIEARGAVNEARFENGELFQRFTAMEWHNFDRSGFAYSQRQAEQRRQAELDREQRAALAATLARQREADKPEARAAKAKAEKAWRDVCKAYQVTQAHYKGSGRIPVKHRDGVAHIGHEPVNLWLHDEHIKPAEASGMRVKLIDPSKMLQYLPSLADAAGRL